MAKAKFTMGDFDYIISHMAGQSEELAKAGLYAAAGVYADVVRQRLNGLNAVDGNYNMIAKLDGRMGRLSQEQKEGLQEGLGISPMRSKGGAWNLRIGFDGYNDVVTERWPSGQPNIMIAAMTEHGSSTFHKQPFIRPALEQANEAALRAAEEAIAELIKKTTK